MRISELFEENSDTPALITNLMVLLTSAKASNIMQLDTDLIVQELNNQGHAVSKASILKALNNNPIVKSADENTVVISDRDQNGKESSDKEDSADKVEKMAQKGSKEFMKNG